jgi:hypothetical protein
VSDVRIKKVAVRTVKYIEYWVIFLIACYDLQMGYGSRALSLLKKYYEFKIPSIEEDQLPQEHIKSVEDEKVGLLEERIGKLFILTSSLRPIGSHRNCLHSNVHIIAFIYNIQLSLYLHTICKPKGVLFF